MCPSILGVALVAHCCGTTSGPVTKLWSPIIDAVRLESQVADTRDMDNSWWAPDLDAYLDRAEPGPPATKNKPAHRFLTAPSRTEPAATARYLDRHVMHGWLSSAQHGEDVGRAIAGRYTVNECRCRSSGESEATRCRDSRAIGRLLDVLTSAAVRPQDQLDSRVSLVPTLQPAQRQPAVVERQETRRDPMAQRQTGG
jgi:hypothetical protein